MAKQDIIDYVMNTPGNTNKMVLEGMLGAVDGVKLPEISEEDEGKVLTVINGKWDKGIASGENRLIPTVDKTITVDGVERNVVGFVDANGSRFERPLFVSESLDDISVADAFVVSYEGMTFEVQPLTMSEKGTLRGVGSDYQPSERSIYLIEDTDAKYVVYYINGSQIVDSVVVPSTANIQYIAGR